MKVGAGIQQIVCIRVDWHTFTNVIADFVTSRLSGFDSDLGWKTDTVGHGSHCSGTIAAAKNGIGVVGVAPDAEIYTIKVFDDDGTFAYGENDIHVLLFQRNAAFILILRLPFTGSSIVSAVRQCVDAGFNIVSMSLG